MQHDNYIAELDFGKPRIDDQAVVSARQMGYVGVLGKKVRDDRVHAEPADLCHPISPSKGLWLRMPASFLPADLIATGASPRLVSRIVILAKKPGR